MVLLREENNRVHSSLVRGNLHEHGVAIGYTPLLVVLILLVLAMPSRGLGQTNNGSDVHRANSHRVLHFAHALVLFYYGIV